MTHAEAEDTCVNNLDGYLAEIADKQELETVHAYLESSGILTPGVHIGNDPNDPADYDYMLYDDDESMFWL